MSVHAVDEEVESARVCASAEALKLRPFGRDKANRSVAHKAAADGWPAHCDDAEARVAVIRSLAWAMFVPRYWPGTPCRARRDPKAPPA